MNVSMKLELFPIHPQCPSNCRLRDMSPTLPPSTINANQNCQNCTETCRALMNPSPINIPLAFHLNTSKPPDLSRSSFGIFLEYCLLSSCYYFFFSFDCAAIIVQNFFFPLSTFVLPIYKTESLFPLYFSCC